MTRQSSLLLLQFEIERQKEKIVFPPSRFLLALLLALLFVYFCNAMKNNFVLIENIYFRDGCCCLIEFARFKK
jgi:hypothetical protein